MKYFIYIINCLLVLLIPTTFVLTPTNTKSKNKLIKTEVKVKKLESGVFKQEKFESPKEETKEEKDSLEKENQEQIEKQESKTTTAPKLNQTIEKRQVNTTSQPEARPTTDVLETQIGKMSGYGTDCRGCSGYLASGKYVGDGNIYYNDSKYGRVRIVAGDYTYKFGTIIRIKNSRAGNNIIAIVLDRGSSIGIGKKFMFDLLYKTESDALKDEVSYNTTFEVLRYGY